MTVRLTIHGRVQGVFYRDWTVRTARELGLAGWVRNCPNGTVEALVQGEAAAVREMIARMRSGPPRAEVERIEERASEIEELERFTRR
jgi:acylphosphatase